MIGENTNCKNISAQSNLGALNDKYEVAPKPHDFRKMGLPEGIIYDPESRLIPLENKVKIPSQVEQCVNNNGKCLSLAFHCMTDCRNIL